MKVTTALPGVSLILLALLLPVMSHAQPMRQIDQADHVTFCRSSGAASRIRSGCEEDEAQSSGERLEIERTITIELNETSRHMCSAVVDMEYYQSNAFARVRGELRNEDCAASNGQYTVFARIRTQEGEIETLEFEETWQREDDQSIELDTRYPIGENVELMRLNTRRMVCRCDQETEPVDAATTP